MTTASPTSEPERPKRTAPIQLTVRGRVLLWWVLTRCWIRTSVLSPRDPITDSSNSSDSLVRGELMVAAPLHSPIDSVLTMVANKFRRYTSARFEFANTKFEVDNDSNGQGEGAREIVPLRYRYGRLICTPGVEQYLAQAIKVVAGNLLARGFTASAVQSMRLVQNSNPAPSGVIDFDVSFLDEIRSLRSATSQGSGVTVTIVDRMMPTQITDHHVVDGHGTLMYEVVQTVAPAATIDAVAIGDQFEASSWSLLSRQSRSGAMPTLWSSA